MKNIKDIFNSRWFIIIAFVFVGLLGYFVWNTFLSTRYSTAGACDKGAGCLYTAVNGNRSVTISGFSADGSRFLTDGSADGIIHDATSGKKISDLDEGHANHRFVVSGDRSQIAGYNNDGVKFFDWEGELLRTWAIGLENAVQAVAMVPLVDGFVTADKNGVSLWNMADGELIIQLADTEGGFLYVAASADGEYVAGYQFVDNEIHIWPLQNLENSIVIPDVEALSIQFSADGSLLAAGGPDGAYVWDTLTGNLVTAVEPEGMVVTTVSLNEDGDLLAVGFENGFVTVLNVADDSLLHTFPHEFTARRIAFAPDSSSLAVGLDYESETSSNQLILRKRTGTTFRPGESLRTGSNRVSVSPGYAIVWSLDHEFVAE